MLMFLLRITVRVYLILQSRGYLICFTARSNRIADSRRSMGLGLALCKSIVNAHGGEITVSDHLPQGSVFTFFNTGWGGRIA